MRVQASATPTSLTITPDDPTNFTLAILGDLHMDPRDTDHSYEGRDHIKKILDDVKDTPRLLPGKVPSVTEKLSTMDLKVKKGIMDLKRKLMDVGKAKDEL